MVPKTSESVVLNQPMPSPPDALSCETEAAENPEETEEQKKQRHEENAGILIDTAEDCCYICHCGDEDANCCLLCIRCFCTPWRLLCNAIAECSEDCCECCANCIHSSCEADSSADPSNVGGGGCCDTSNTGCCGGDNSPDVHDGTDCDCDCNCFD